MVRTGSLFRQILSLFQRSNFARHVHPLKAEHRAKGISRWEQFVTMRFCQLTQARSLREITDGLKCREGKLKHLRLARGIYTSIPAYRDPFAGRIGRQKTHQSHKSRARQLGG